jgi:beta-xylosidase
LLDADVDVLNHGDGPYPYPGGGTVISPFHSSEGNKIFKRDGLYYLQHIEFLDTGQGHGTYLFRSKNLYGTLPDGTAGRPGHLGKYDVSKFGSTIPGQGGFFNTPDDRWFWIGQLNTYGSDGRKPNLLPVTWIDHWPVPGANIKDSKGEMAWQLKKPIDGQPIVLPEGSDEFDATTLDPRWQWNHDPRADHWSLTQRPGFLRLHAWQPLKPGAFFTAGNTVGERFFRSTQTTLIAKLDFAGLADGQHAGFAHYNGGKTYAAIGIVQSNGARSLQYEENGKAQNGPAIPSGQTELWLRSVVKFDDLNQFAYSFDGKTFIDFGGNYKLKTGNYRGDFAGIFTFNDQADAGYVDVDFFHYEVVNR